MKLFAGLMMIWWLWYYPLGTNVGPACGVACPARVQSYQDLWTCLEARKLYEEHSRQYGNFVCLPDGRW